jgi:hypothetical protein
MITKVEISNHYLVERTDSGIINLPKITVYQKKDLSSSETSKSHYPNDIVLIVNKNKIKVEINAITIYKIYKKYFDSSSPSSLPSFGDKVMNIDIVGILNKIRDSFNFSSIKRCCNEGVLIGGKDGVRDYAFKDSIVLNEKFETPIISVDDAYQRGILKDQDRKDYKESFDVIKQLNKEGNEKKKKQFILWYNERYSKSSIYLDEAFIDGPIIGHLNTYPFETNHMTICIVESKIKYMIPGKPRENLPHSLFVLKSIYTSASSSQIETLFDTLSKFWEQHLFARKI